MNGSTQGGKILIKITASLLLMVIGAFLKPYVQSIFDRWTRRRESEVSTVKGFANDLHKVRHHLDNLNKSSRDDLLSFYEEGTAFGWTYQGEIGDLPLLSPDLKSKLENVREQIYVPASFYVDPAKHGRGNGLNLGAVGDCNTY
jgi:hypothetical protein